VGAGNMARAILKGVLARGLLPASGISVSSPSGPSEAVRTLGVACTRDNAQAVADADVVLLCVKPHFVATAVASFARSLREGAVLVSVAAGITTAQLEEVNACAGFVSLCVAAMRDYVRCHVHACSYSLQTGPRGEGAASRSFA
jgi:pyrroline-5-carboxylate reductase